MNSLRARVLATFFVGALLKWEAYLDHRAGQREFTNATRASRPVPSSRSPCGATPWPRRRAKPWSAVVSVPDPIGLPPSPAHRGCGRRRRQQDPASGSRHGPIGPTPLVPRSQVEVADADGSGCGHQIPALLREAVDQGPDSPGAGRFGISADLLPGTPHSMGDGRMADAMNDAGTLP